MSNEPETRLAESDEQIAWVLGHEGMSPWLKRALHDALATDPIAAGNDVEVLRHLLQVRAEAWARGQLQAVSSARLRCDSYIPNAAEEPS